MFKDIVFIFNPDIMKFYGLPILLLFIIITLIIAITIFIVIKEIRKND